MTAEIGVLIVEDEPIIAQNIERHLEYLGYRARGIASGADDALELLRDEGADVVLMDIHLEGPVDGVDLAGRIQEHFQVPVVYLTGLMDDQTLERAKITQPFGYIAKPFTRRELQVTLEIALYKSRIEQQLRDQESHIQSLLETMNQGFCLIGADGRIVSANRMFVGLLGLTLEDLQRRKFIDFVHPDDQPAIKVCMADPRAEHEKPHKIRLLAAGRGIRPLIIVPKTIVDEAGYRGCFLSVTEFPDDV